MNPTWGDALATIAMLYIFFPLVELCAEFWDRQIKHSIEVRKKK